MVSETLTPDAIAACTMRRGDGLPVDWIVSERHVPYPEALEAMRLRAGAIAAGQAREAVWLLEHPPLYTAGTSAKPGDLLDPDRFPVFEAGRGGQYTYHGPGQRVAYVMLDLRERGRDVRCLVHNLEGWIIDTLAGFAVAGERRPGYVGVWIRRPGAGLGRQDKIAAIGVRVSRWVSFHGIAFNVSPELSHYAGIVPCGIADGGVTSLGDLGHDVSMAQVDRVFAAHFADRFGPIRQAGDEGLVLASPSPQRGRNFESRGIGT